MARIQKSRRDRVFASLAVAGATLTGGIVSYSVAVASPVTEVPQVRSAALPEGRAENCYDGDPDLNWYRQRGDQMTSNQMLPNTISFRTGATDLLPAGGNPCGGGDNGGGGQGPSCLSEFGFDPEDYWAVIDIDWQNVTTVDIFAAVNGSFTPLTMDAIDTTTACTVTYEWIVGEGNPMSILFQGDPASMENGSASGTTTTEMTVSGLSGDGMGAMDMYVSYVCGDVVGLEVSDGINSYVITAPPCSNYRFESILYTNNATLEYDFQDPWGRADSALTGPAAGGMLNSDAIISIVKPQSPLTITFGSASTYTLRTGDDWNVNCTDASVNASTTVNNSSLLANATWSDPTPADDRIYCIEEFLL
jgi:hypothetical protein